MPHPPIEVAHEIDAAWIIALIIAIYGGDPPPSVGSAAAFAARLMATQLEPAAAKAVTEALKNSATTGLKELNPAELTKKLKTVGIEVLGESAPRAHLLLLYSISAVTEEVGGVDWRDLIQQSLNALPQ
jgi:hypothetical protein